MTEKSCQSNSEKKIIFSAADTVTKKCDEQGNIIYKFNSKQLEDDDVEEAAEKKISEVLNNFIGDQFENFIVLVGAGASIINSSKVKEKENYSGKTIGELTEKIKNFLEKNDDTLSFEEMKEKINYLRTGNEYKNSEMDIEDLLSKAEIAREYIDLGQENKVKFNKTIKVIKEKIRELCDLTLCNSYHPHARFLEKVTSRRKTHNRVKIFTTNYDTLFEQAAQKEGFIVVDGFSYHLPRRFNPFMFDYDFVRRGDDKITDEPDYVEKVFHLYKLHGSVDWEKRENGDIIKQKDPKNPLLIYPRRDKFEQSYEPPYFEMFSRLQMELKKKSTILITIGFSFADKHVSIIVENAVRNNPELKMLVVDWDIYQNNFKFFRDRVSEGYQNIMLFSADFPGFEKAFLKQKAYSDRFFEDRGHLND